MAMDHFAPSVRVGKKPGPNRVKEDSFKRPFASDVFLLNTMMVYKFAPTCFNILETLEFQSHSNHRRTAFYTKTIGNNSSKKEV